MGRLDTVMQLYNAERTLTFEDDDSGDPPNARIESSLQPGTYLLPISSFASERGKSTVVFDEIEASEPVPSQP